MSRVDAGRQAQAAGSGFEAWIERQHEKARLLGIVAHIAHNYARAEVKQGRLIFTGKGVADYTGTLDRTGKTVAAEAKSVKDSRLPYSMIDKKQADHLDAVANASGLALLLAEFRLEDQILPRRYAVPWKEVPWEILRTARSVSWEALEKWHISPDPTQCYLERFHKRGTPTTPVKLRNYPRE